MSFINSSVLVLTDTGTTHSFQTAQSSPISVAIPAGSTGTWTWVVSREGYSTQIGTFDTTGGGVDSASPTPSQLTQANGTILFTGSSSANVNIVFDLTLASETCFIDVGDGSVTAQQIIDEIETALLTENGCKFLAASSGSQSTFSVLAGQTYLLLGSQYRVRRANVGDVNAAIEAFVISADGTPLNGTNGGVQFLTASEGLTAQQVYDLFTSATNADAFKADISSLATTTNVTDAQTAIVAEINANEAKIDTLTTSVAAIPTTDSVADLTPVLTAISNLNDITTAQIRTELAAELARLDVAVSSVAYNDTALTALVNALPTLVEMEASAALTAVADITGLSTHSAADVVTAMQVVANDFKADLTTLNDFDPSTDQVIVATNNDKTDYTLANNAITSSVVATGAFNNSSFTTGYFNSVNSEVDTALADYDGPTKAELDAAEASIKADIAAIPSTDISSLETKVEADARQAILIAEHDSTQASIAALNDFDPALDTVARVTLVDTTTLNTDMRGTDGANTVTPPSTAQIEAALLNEGDGQQLIDAIVQAIGNTNVSEVALVAAIRADIERSGGLLDLLPTLSEIEASTIIAKASEIAALNDITAADVVTAMQVVANDFKATGFATPANVTAAQTAITTEVNSNETKIDTVITNIASLNNLSAADVLAQLNTYDAPTKAELDTAQATIINAVNAGVLTPTQVWDYLQSETTVSGSLKEALELTLKNAKLIPAAL